MYSRVGCCGASPAQARTSVLQEGSLGGGYFEGNLEGTLTFSSCGGTNGNRNVQCSIHIEGTSASSLTCTVANPAISGGDNTGNCQTDTGLHLSCLHAMTIAQMKIVHTRNNPYAYPSDGGK